MISPALTVVRTFMALTSNAYYTLFGRDLPSRR
jgi:hypothetical protein